MYYFEYKNEDYMALGTRDGSVIVKQTEHMMSKLSYCQFELEQADSKVTVMQFEPGGRLVVGTKSGSLFFYDLGKKEL